MNIKLRKWTMDDLDNLLKYANNSNIANNMTDGFPHPYRRENGIAFIEMTEKENPRKILAITLDDKAIGSIGVFPLNDIFRKSAEMGYWLAEPYWGKGIVAEAVKQMIDYGFASWDIDRIFARPFGRNKASQRVLEKTGFVLEGRYEKTIIKNEKYEDELVYAVRRKK
jgi:[ribosomal protein S5]-alanine N-acetyltransferase